jgi:hypothetical protein
MFGLLSGGVGRGGWVGLEPFIEGNGEGKELLLAVQGVNLFDVELGVPEGGVVKAADVVEEVSGEGAVRVDDGAVEAKVSVIFGDLLVDGRVMDGDGDEGDLGAHGLLGRKEATVDVFVERGGDLVVIGREELDADIFE